MKILLDTHTFLWFIDDDERISSEAKAKIEDRNNQGIISICSLWEIAIKIKLGKLILKSNFSQLLGIIEQNGFQLLNIDFKHTKIISSLALHHRDPFDRMLIAQSLHENIPIITKDPNFRLYDVKILW